MTFDPMSVEVTCVTLPKDHCVQVPWQYIIKVCGYSDQFCKIPHTYIHILYTTYIHTTYRMSDHIVSYWTQFRRDKNLKLFSVRVKNYLSLQCCENKTKQKTKQNKTKNRFLPFLKSIFLRETDLWVTLGDFMVKMQNWESKSLFNWKLIRQKRNVVRRR